MRWGRDGTGCVNGGGFRIEFHLSHSSCMRTLDLPHSLATCRSISEVAYAEYATYEWSPSSEKPSMIEQMMPCVNDSFPVDSNRRYFMARRRCSYRWYHSFSVTDLWNSAMNPRTNIQYISTGIKLYSIVAGNEET